MHRVLLVFLLACSAGPKPQAKPRTHKISLVARTWLEAVDLGLDCPMSVTEARGVRSLAPTKEGDVARVIENIACLCDVVEKPRIAYDSCVTRRRSYATPDRDEERLLAWHNALLAKVRKLPPQKLARATPLARQLRAVRSSAR